MVSAHFDRKAFFRCVHCGMAMKESNYSISLALYGGIFLHGRDDGYFGITCANPICKITILKRIDIQFLNNLKGYISASELGHDSNG